MKIETHRETETLLLYCMAWKADADDDHSVNENEKSKVWIVYRNK
jgi:hypothetical protein